MHFLSAPLDLILKLTTGSSARVNARVFTRVSGTRSGAHCSPFLSNSTSVCQRQSERAHTHCAPLTHSPAHTRALTHTHTHTRRLALSDPGGEERKRERAPVRLPPTSLFASYLCLSVSSFSTNARIVSLFSPLSSPLSRTKEQQFKDQTGVCKIINTTESKTRRKRRKEHG